MQFFSTIAALLLTFKCVSAVNEIRFILNNGFSPFNASGCFLASEVNAINEAFGYQRRSLRSKDIEPTSSEERSLQLFSGIFYDEKTSTSYCKNICAGIAPGCYWKRGCVGFRALEVKDEKEDDRTLSDMSCSTEIDQLHTKLDAVREQVQTASCKNFLSREKRSASCYPNVVYGQIEGARIWNITSDTIQSPVATILPGGNTTICKSMKLNMESLNQLCVVTTKLIISGPNGYKRSKYEGVTPMAVFGDTGTVFNAATLPHIGKYTFLIIPDGHESKQKSFTINVKNC